MFRFFKNNISVLSDSDLMEKFCQNGDKEALGELFKRYANTLYGIALFYFKDKERAQDVIMEIFEQLLQKPNIKHTTYVKAWLGTITKNFCISYLRKDQTQRKRDEHYTAYEYQEAELNQEIELENKSLDEKMVYDALECLKPEQKTCVQLFYLGNKSYQDIVIETGLELNAVKSYIQNGKRNMKIFLIAHQQKVKV